MRCDVWFFFSHMLLKLHSNKSNSVVKLQLKIVLFTCLQCKTVYVLQIVPVLSLSSYSLHAGLTWWFVIVVVVVGDDWHGQCVPSFMKATHTNNVLIYIINSTYNKREWKRAAAQVKAQHQLVVGLKWWKCILLLCLYFRKKVSIKF